MNRNDSLWFTHALMNYPFPFKKKDLITKHELRRNNGGVVIDIVSVPEFKPETKSVERIKNYWGTWNLAYSIGGETNVECRFISGDKPLFPRFMQDPVVQKITIDSFSDLKSLAETQ